MAPMVAAPPVSGRSTIRSLGTKPAICLMSAYILVKGTGFLGPANMNVGEYCNHEVVIAHRDESALEATKLMRRHHAGDMVVVAAQDGRLLPLVFVALTGRH
jgi:hypothetical protein